MSRRDPSDPRDPSARAADAAERRAAAPPDGAGPPGGTGGEGARRGGREPARDAGHDRGRDAARDGTRERRAAAREERRRERRRAGRRGVGRRRGEQAAGAATAQRPTGDRRRQRTLREQREQWALVRRWLRRHDLDEYRTLVERLAQVAFGPAATVMPHLRRSHGRRYLVFVVDAACPEATSNYEEFLPLEQAFWTAYATIPKPSAPFVVAVRPARGWVRTEALMPLFAQLPTPDLFA